jgi:hypothetical protein
MELLIPKQSPRACVAVASETMTRITQKHLYNDESVEAMVMLANEAFMKKCPAGVR